MLATNGVPHFKALKSLTTRLELLGDAAAAGAWEQACSTRGMAPGALEQAYTTHAGAGLVAIEMKSGKIAHQSPSFLELFSWVPVEARGNIRFSLEARDDDTFQSFCQSAVKDAGEPYGDTFLELDKVVGRSITVRFFTRAPGPPGLRNPEWLLMVRAVKLTLVGVQLAGEMPAAGKRLPFFGQARIPEAVGVFTADLSGGTPQQWTLQVAHVRDLLDSEMASGTYDMDMGNFKPFEALAILFFQVSKEQGRGVCASLFSRATAQLEYAATSALNVAQLSASWLTRKALRYTHQWSLRLNDDDDTVSISSIGLFKLFGGLSTSISQDLGGGKVGFSHGGLDILCFVADPEQPLDRILRATFVRIASAKNAGEFDVHSPFVFSLIWRFDQDLSQILCKRVGANLEGKKEEMSCEEDVSKLLEKLIVSPGGGHLSDGSATICVGQSDVSRGGEEVQNLSATEGSISECDTNSLSPAW